MKILIIGWGYPPKIDGGLDIAVKELFEGLQKKDINVDLMLPSERAPEKENIIPIDVEGDMFSKAEQLSRAAAKKASKYDIIHTHDWFGAEAGFKASKYSDIKWISTFHSLSSSRNRTPSDELEKLEKIAVENADKVTAVSDKLADEIEEKYGLRPETVYNGFSNVDTQEKVDFDTEIPVFFYVGRHAEQKGLEHLIYGFDKYLEENEGLLVLGGDGHLKDSLEDFVEILDIEESVRFEGFIPDRELGSYYSTADVFVSPSINEPFGLTISEALNAGTPVLCTESGINELLPSEAVTIVEPNSDSIAEGLEKSLKKDSVEVEGRSWDEMVNDYIKSYRELIK
ncbi:MAG: glycosyltransferase family 4 protein [Candidatus Nanohaloarchaea archaeon]